MLGIVPGGWLGMVNGRLCITNSNIPCDRVDILAHAALPPWKIEVQRTIEQTVTGTVVNTPPDPLPQFSNALLAVVRQGNGQMFVAPGSQWNSRVFFDVRAERIIENWFSEAGALPRNLPAYGTQWLLHDTPALVQPFSAFTARVTVRNTGTITWEPSVHAVTYRWRPQACPASVVQYGGNQYIPYEVRRDEVLRDMAVTVFAPSTPGVYCLEYDMAEIPVLWFSAQGASMLRVSVEVAGGPAP
jgi:hypothetical protein